jgi:hypothetical protein
MVVGAAGDAVMDLVLVMGSFMLNGTGHHTARDKERQDCQENANAKNFSHITEELTIKRQCSARS